MRSNCRLKVGLYINCPEAGTLRFVRCLQAWDMDFVSVRPDHLGKLGALGIDTLLLPGGWYGINRRPGQNQYKVEATAANRRQGEALCAYVRDGGGLVGVCAGAFNVVWLGLIEADISRSRGCGLHALEVVAPGHPLAVPVLEKGKHPERPWEPIPVIRVNGPIFFRNIGSK